MIIYIYIIGVTIGTEDDGIKLVDLNLGNKEISITPMNKYIFPAQTIDNWFHIYEDDLYFYNGNNFFILNENNFETINLPSVDYEKIEKGNFSRDSFIFMQDEEIYIYNLLTLEKDKVSLPAKIKKYFRKNTGNSKFIILE